MIIYMERKMKFITITAPIPGGTLCTGCSNVGIWFLFNLKPLDVIKLF